MSEHVTHRIGRPPAAPRRRVDWFGHLHALCMGVVAALLILATLLPHRLDGDVHRWTYVAHTGSR